MHIEPMEYFANKSRLQPEFFLAFALSMQTLPAITSLPEKNPAFGKQVRARNYVIGLKVYHTKKGIDPQSTNYCLQIRPVGKLEKASTLVVKQSLAAKIASEKSVIDISNRTSLGSSMHAKIRFYQQVHDARWLWSEAIRLNLIKPEVLEQIQLAQAMVELRTHT